MNVKALNAAALSVRSFAIASISNGIALHGGLYPFCVTFWGFSALQNSHLESIILY